MAEELEDDWKDLRHETPEASDKVEGKVTSMTMVEEIRPGDILTTGQVVSTVVIPPDYNNHKVTIQAGEKKSYHMHSEFLQIRRVEEVALPSTWKVSDMVQVLEEDKFHAVVARVDDGGFVITSLGNVYVDPNTPLPVRRHE
jgi:hypothetical protein